MNRRPLGGNLCGWAADDRLSVCCQVFLRRAIRFMATDRTGEREILVGSAFFIWISAPSTSSLPVRCKWMTLARMWITIVTNTVVVDWPVVGVGGWEMGERGEIILQSLQQLPRNSISSLVEILRSFLHCRPTWPTSGLARMCYCGSARTHIINHTVCVWTQSTPKKQPFQFLLTVLLRKHGALARLLHHVDTEHKNTSCALEYPTISVFVQIGSRRLTIICSPKGLSKDWTGSLTSAYLTSGTYIFDLQKETQLFWNIINSLPSYP